MKPLLPSQRNGLESATATFERSLPGSPAVEYLEGRGFDLPTATALRLGWVERELPGFEQFVGRLAIPNICAAGHVVGMKFRALNDAGPKYLGLEGYDARLFNLVATNDPSPLIALTEGEIDALSLARLGIPAVGVPGAHLWKRHHERIFEDYERVVLVRDTDEAGGALAKRLSETDLPLVVIRPPGGCKDVNEAIVAGHGAELVAAIRGDSE